MARNKNPRSGRGQGKAVCSDSRNSTMSLADLLARLSVEFAVLAEFRPLALRIDLPPCDAARGATEEQRRRALIEHCCGERYLRAVANGGLRFGLDGTPSGEVSELQRRAAKRRLEIIARTAKRKAARLAKPRRRE